MKKKLINSHRSTFVVDRSIMINIKVYLAKSNCCSSACTRVARTRDNVALTCKNVTKTFALGAQSWARSARIKRNYPSDFIRQWAYFTWVFLRSFKIWIFSINLTSHAPMAFSPPPRSVRWDNMLKFWYSQSWPIPRHVLDRSRY